MIEYVAPFDVSLMSNEAVVSDESSRVIVRVSVPSVSASAASGKLIIVVPEALTVAVPVSELLIRSDAETPERV